VSLIENLLLDRCSNPKTGWELVEEIEQRIEKGKEIEKYREENKAKTLARWRLFPISSR